MWLGMGTWRSGGGEKSERTRPWHNAPPAPRSLSAARTSRLARHCRKLVLPEPLRPRRPYLGGQRKSRVTQPGSHHCHTRTARQQHTLVALAACRGTPAKDPRVRLSPVWPEPPLAFAATVTPGRRCWHLPAAHSRCPEAATHRLPMVSSMLQSWMRLLPFSVILKPSILMSRLVGRLVSTPVTVRNAACLSLGVSAVSSDRDARSAVLPLGVADALPSPPLAALRASRFAASAAFFSSFVWTGLHKAPKVVSERTQEQRSGVARRRRRPARTSYCQASVRHALSAHRAPRGERLNKARVVRFREGNERMWQLTRGIKVVHHGAVLAPAP